MAQQCRVITGTPKTGTGTDDFNVVGISDNLLACWMSATLNEHGFSSGYFAGSTGNGKAGGCQTENAAKRSDTSLNQNNDALCMLYQDDGATLDGDGDWNAWNTTGVQIYWNTNTTNNTNNAELGFVVFGGNSASEMEAAYGQSSCAGSSSTDAIGGLGFEPDIIFFRRSTASSGLANGYVASEGIAVQSPSAGMCWAAFHGHNVATSNPASIFYDNGTVLAQFLTPTSINATLSVQSWDPGGFTVINAGSATIYYEYLCIKMPGASFDLSTYTAPTTNGTDPETGVGFEPDFMQFFYCAHATANSITSDGSETNIAIGAADGTNEFCHARYDEDNLADMSTGAAGITTACLMLPDDSVTTQPQGAWDSFDSDGFTLDWTNTPTAKTYAALAIKYAIPEQSRTCNAAAMTLTAYDVSATPGSVSRTCTAAAVDLTAYDATAVVEQNRTCTAAALDLTAYDVTATAVNNRTCDAAAVDLTGYDASAVPKHVNRTCDDAAISLTAYDATATPGQVSRTCTAAAVDLTAYDATATASNSRTCEAAAVDLTAYDASYTASNSRTCDAAAVDLTAYDAVAEAGSQNRTCDDAAMTLTAYDVSATPGQVTRTCTAAAVDLTAYDASATASEVNRTCTAAAVDLTAYDASATQGFTRTCDAAAVALTAYDASATPGQVTRTCTAAAITLMAYSLRFPPMFPAKKPPIAYGVSRIEVIGPRPHPGLRGNANA